MSQPKTIRTTEALQLIAAGVTKLSDAVTVTLGPNGRNVMYAGADGPVVTKDGVTVAEQIAWADQTQDMAAQVILQAARRTADTAGDGTTTTTLLASELVRGAIRELSAEKDAMELAREVQQALPKIVDELVDQTLMATENIVLDIAKVSANGDELIGSVVGRALNKVGADGIVRVEPSRSNEISLSFGTGYLVDKGSLSPYFLKGTEVTLQNCYIIVSNSKIGRSKPLINMLQALSQTADRTYGQGNWSLLVIGSMVDGDALNFLVENVQKGRLNAAAIRAPGYGDNHVEHLLDLAVATGATVIGDERRVLYTADLSPDVLGWAPSVIVTRTETRIIPETQSPELQQHVAMLVEDARTSRDLVEINKLRDRINRLSNSVATIAVGAPTEAAKKEFLFRIEDALGAARAALLSGVLPGAGVALLRCSEKESVTHGERLLRRVCSAPFRRLLGERWLEVRSALKSAEQGGEVAATVDVRSLTVGSCLENGVIDPADVTIQAVTNAVSAACLLFTTACTIEDDLDSIHRRMRAVHGR